LRDATRKSTRRSLLWWISTTLAPVGIIGGPLEIANMLAGIIEWHGPIAYIVQYWDSTFGKTFATLFNWLAAIAGLPDLPAWLSDYLTLGALFSISLIRAITLLQEGTTPHDDRMLGRLNPLVRLPMLGLILLTVIAALVIVWPFHVIAVLLLLSYHIRVRHLREDPSTVFGWLVMKAQNSLELYADFTDTLKSEKFGVQLLLTLLPFVLFFVIWAVNALYRVGVT
jgi:hypothetical protein